MFLAFSTNYSGTADGWTAYYETDLVEVTEMQVKEDFLVYPNPVENTIFININQENGTPVNIKLLDLNGNELISSTYDFPESGQVHLDVNRITSGMYFLKIDAQGEFCIIKKIIVK
jgi:argininosuccinate synthase